MDGFYWLIPGVLAGSRRPGGADGASLAEELAWLERQGIGAVLSLTETALVDDVVRESGLTVLHLPVPDMTAPSPDQILEALKFIDAQRASDVPVLVHCWAGQGRTGTVLAAYLIRNGYQPDQAISDVRSVCPHAVENDAQVASLQDFAHRRDWLI